MADFIFKGTVDEIDVGKLQEGLIARIKAGALPSDLVTGKVARIAPPGVAEGRRDAVRRRDRVEARAGHRAARRLLGQRRPRHPREGRGAGPERLVTIEDGGKKEFVSLPAEGESKEPRKVAVKLGIADGMNPEVVEGLRKGDRVIEAPPKETKG